MTKIDEGFASLGRTRVPDVWHDIEGRDPRNGADGPSGLKRLGVVALALVIATAGIGLAVVRFHPTDRQPATAPRNGRIAFTAIVSGEDIPQIYAANPDGSDRVQLTSDPTIKGSLAWSPDGAALAFVAGSASEGPESVRLIDPTGSNDRTLCTSCVTTFQRRGPLPVEVLPASEALRWSPDGVTLAAPSAQNDRNGLALIDAASGAVTFVPTSGTVEGLSWDPTGGRLAIETERWGDSNNPEANDFGIYLLDTASLTLTLVTSPALRDFPDRQPEFSPDGSWISFIGGVFDDQQKVATGQLFLVRPDGSERHTITTVGGSDSIASAVWDPDGSRLAVLIAPAQGSWRFQFVGPDGSVSGVEGCERDPACPSRLLAWAPDGSSIAYATADEQGFFVRDLGMGSAVNLTGGLLTRVPGASACCLAWQVLRGETTTPPGPTTGPAQYHAEVTQTIDTGRRFPEGVIAGEGAVWVATSDLDGSGAGDLLRIDPASGGIEARIPMRSLPTWEFGGGGLAVGLGSVWVTGFENAEGPGCCDTVVTRIDPQTNSVAETIPVGPGSDDDVWVDETGIWVLTGPDNSDPTHLVLYHLDPSTHERRAAIEIPSNWSQSVFASGGWIWVLGNTDDTNGAPPETLFKIDPSTNQVVGRSDPANGNEIFVAPSGDRIWFSNQGLRALDASTGQQVVGPLDQSAVGCCSELVSDGVGGVWVVSVRGGVESTGVSHVDANGDVIGHADSNPGDDANGISAAFDPSTNSIWVVHYERTVSKLQITPR
jgi:Tol biopolymer transport system component